MRDVALKMIEKLDEAEGEAEDHKTFLASCMARAEKHQAEGDLPAARKIWQGIVDLYHSDEVAGDYVEECNKLLKLTMASTPDTAETEQ